MRYRGVAYYPEAWPQTRWDEDIKLMRDAGVNFVRMGEFAWARFEPTQGRFELEWWQDICERMCHADIQVLACTPSAAPPAWLINAYPEVLHVREDGSRASHGMRRHYCPGSPRYRTLVHRVNVAIAEAVKDNPAVIAWQLDNENAPEDGIGCCCDGCTVRFRDWLKHRYGNLHELNRAWGTVFWAGEYSEWGEVAPPYPNHSRKSWRLDYIRFVSRVFAEFANEQAATLRSVRPNWRITTNCWVGLNPAMDIRELFDNLDVAANDAYLDYYASREVYSAVWDFYRNIKSPRAPFWVTETGAWHSTNTQAGCQELLRPYAYLAIAKGVDAWTYFRWRQSCMGEEEHPAVLDWSGRPGRAYKQIGRIFNEIDGLGSQVLELPLPRAKVAILFHFDSAHFGQLADRMSMMHLVEDNAMLGRLHIMSDIVSIRDKLDLSQYKLVIMPQLEMVDKELGKVLHQYIANGGTLLAQPRLATLNDNGGYQTVTMPAGLTDLFGVKVRERWDICRGRFGTHAFSPEPEDAPAMVCVCLDFAGRVLEVAGVEHMEHIHPEPGSRILGVYQSGLFKGEPVLTENRHGQGICYYQACWLDEAGTRAIMEYVLKRSGIKAGPRTPKTINILKRGNLRFYLNFDLRSVTVPLLAPGNTILGDIKGGNVCLPPAGVCIVREG